MHFICIRIKCWPLLLLQREPSGRVTGVKPGVHSSYFFLLPLLRILHTLHMNEMPAAFSQDPAASGVEQVKRAGIHDLAPLSMSSFFTAPPRSFHRGRLHFSTPSVEPCGCVLPNPSVLTLKPLSFPPSACSTVQSSLPTLLCRLLNPSIFTHCRSCTHAGTLWCISSCLSPYFSPPFHPLQPLCIDS